MLMELDTCGDILKTKPVKNIQVYSDYAYFGEVKGKLLLVKEKPNFNSFVNAEEEVFLYHNVRNNEEKYNFFDFDKDTLKKIRNLDEEQRRLLFNKYFEENPTKDEKDLKSIRKIYTLRYRMKEHI